MVKFEINVEMVYGKLDRLCGEVARLRERQSVVETKIEAFLKYQKNHDTHKYRSNIALVAIIGVVLTAVNIFI